MTIAQISDFFDILQDKYGSPYFTETEKESFLNQAQLDIVSQFLPKEGDEDSVERNSNVWAILSPYYFSEISTMDANGNVSKGTIETAIAATVGSAVKIIKPLAILWTDTTGTRPVKGPTRQNNWATYLNNVFKVPTSTEPRYYETNTNYVIYPVDQSATIRVNGLRYPKAMDITGSVNTELPEFVHGELVARALELAGVASRDQLLSELKKINNA